MNLISVDVATIGASLSMYCEYIVIDDKTVTRPRRTVRHPPNLVWLFPLRVGNLSSKPRAMKSMLARL